MAAVASATGTITSGSGAPVSSGPAPFFIPLHFQATEAAATTNGQDAAPDGPRLPYGWRDRWYRPEPVSKAAGPSSARSQPTTQAKGEADGEDDDDDSEPFDGFPDFGLKRWMTCMSAWEVEAELEDGEEVKDDESPSGATSPTTNDTAVQLQIAIADEQGGVVTLPGDDSIERPRRPRKVTLGDRRGGRRIALGTQDGCVWIFQERRQEAPQATATPMTPSTSSDALYQRSNRAASRSSLALVSPSTATTAIGSGFHRSAGERESVTAPKAAPAGMSDVVASASPTYTTSGNAMDAEEQLEMQWHAGGDRENHNSGGVMSGMMEALGIQPNGVHTTEHSHSHHEHKTHQHSPQPPSTPSHRRHARSTTERTNVLARHHSYQGGSSTPDSRTRADSSATEKGSSDSGSDIRTSLAEAGLMSAIGLGVGKKRSFLGGSGWRTAPDSAVQSGAVTPSMMSMAPPAIDRLSISEGKRKMPERSLASVEPLFSLQCPSSAPVVSLSVNSGKRDGETVLSVIQQDGRVTLWSLDETLGVHSIDLKNARVPLLDTSELHQHAQHPHSSTATGPSPLARLAALRSTASSPQPRSRVNSNPIHPDALSLPIVSMFEGVSITHTASVATDSSSSLLACYDKTRKRLHLLDCSKATVVAQHTFTDIGQAPPCIQVMADADLVELYYVNDKAALMVRTLRIRAKAKQSASPHLDSSSGKLAPFSSAAAFLRREGYSRPSSRPASFVEDTATDGQRDLGDAGIESAACGLRLLSDGQVVTWSARGLSLAKLVGDSTIALDRKKIKDIKTVHTDQETIVTRRSCSIEVFRVDEKGKLSPHMSFESSQDVCETSSVLDSCPAPIACFRGDEDRLIVRVGNEVAWRGEPVRRAASQHVLASLPFSMERIVLSLASGHLVLCSLSDLVSGRIPEPTSAQHRGDVTLLQTVVNPRTQVKHIFGGTEQGDILVWDPTTLRRQTQRSLLTAPIVAFVAITDQHNALRLHGCVACIAADSSIAIIVLDGLRELYVIPGRDAPLELMAIRSNELMTLYGDGRARVWDMAGLELRRSIGVDQALALLDDGKGWWAQFPIDADHLRREKGAAGVMSSIPTSRAHLAGAMTADIRRVVEAASRMIAPYIVAAVSTSASNGREVDDVAALDAGATDASVAKVAQTSLSSLTMEVPQAKKALHTLRPLLQCLLPFGISDEIDGHCRTLLAGGATNRDDDNRVPKNSIRITSGSFIEPGYLAMNLNESSTVTASQSLRVSSALTTKRIVALLAMLLVLNNIAELQDAASSLIVLLGSLNSVISDDAYHAPTMSILTDYLTDPVTEIKRAAQTLFIASLDDMPSDDLDGLCTQFSHALPNRRSAPTAADEKAAATSTEQHSSLTSSPALPSAASTDDDTEEDLLSSKALLLLGLVATQRYTVMPPTMLKDIAVSISQYLNDEHNPAHQSIAIVLCDRGFSIFQHYFDAMEIVRTLFSISTMAKDASATSLLNTPAAVENRDLARQATLRIAEENTPLFMTTLSLDILHARSPAHCNATMRLVAFMVRRKPLVLYPNLPRLAEAVVKSLDPTVTTMRPVIHRSATIIISELVATYPTIAFHKGLQRLAVGTFEGAIIMYDLKTATRLYVLEAHAASLNGLIFSHDGRRLISICLGDGMVKVWKTGVGLGSLFNFGGAPRQVSALLGRMGGGGSGSTAGSDANHADSAATAIAGNVDASNTGTPAYKSFDFGRLAGSALAAVRLAAARSPPTSPSAYRNSTGGGGQPHHQQDGQPDEASLMTDLTLVRFEWLAERSIKIRVGEATMVFDVA